MRARTTIAAACAAAMLSAAPAAAENGRLADFGFALSSRAPSSPSGMTIHVLFHTAGSSDAKSSPIRGIVIAAPGVRFDSGALPACTASDAEIQALGTNACPASSEAGFGAFTAITGFGPPADPFLGDDHVFNADHQLIEVITPQGSTAAVGVDRLTLDGSTILAHPPQTPGGPPDGETAVRSVDFVVPTHASGGRALVTTPATCPSTGEWRASAAFTFADGSRETVAGGTPCASPADGTGLAPTPARPRCASRRRLSIRVPRAPRARAIRLLVGGRLVRSLRPGARRVTVDLRGRPPGIVHVRLVADARSGRRTIARRRFRTCAGRR